MYVSPLGICIAYNFFRRCVVVVVAVVLPSPPPPPSLLLLFLLLFVFVFFWNRIFVCWNFSTLVTLCMCARFFSHSIFRWCATVIFFFGQFFRWLFFRPRPGTLTVCYRYTVPICVRFLILNGNCRKCYRLIHVFRCCVYANVSSSLYCCYYVNCFGPYVARRSGMNVAREAHGEVEVEPIYTYIDVFY